MSPAWAGAALAEQDDLHSGDRDFDVSKEEVKCLMSHILVFLHFSSMIFGFVDKIISYCVLIGWSVVLGHCSTHTEMVMLEC